MFILTSEDQVILASLARERSQEGEEAEATTILIDGFSRYSEEAIVKLATKKKNKKIYASREEFFRDRCGLLLENIGFAGQTLQQVLESNNGWDWLCQLVRSTGVSDYNDIEDIVQEMSRKFLQARWVEGYNPLISPWGNFLLNPIRNYVNTFKERKSKKVTTGAFSLDREDAQDKHGRTAAACLYDLNVEESPEDRLVEQEVMEDWEDYLRSQKPIRTVVLRDFKKMCTLLPPGVPDIPTDEEQDIFFLQGGLYNSRVTTYELYDDGISLMVPNHLLVDYITTEIEDHVHYQLYDEVTGDFITQKDFPNPYYDHSVVIREQRTWMDFYGLLKQGLQIEEIARELRMAPPSVPARIQRLESLFRKFLLVSPKIPSESRIKAAKTYCCPNPKCRKLDVIERDECRVCGTDMRSEVAEVRWDTYPWPRVYVSRKTYERLGNRRQAMVVQRCSLSMRH